MPVTEQLLLLGQVLRHADTTLLPAHRTLETLTARLQRLAEAGEVLTLGPDDFEALLTCRDTLAARLRHTQPYGDQR